MHETLNIFYHCVLVFFTLLTLEDTARYAGLLLAPAEGFGLRPRLFFAIRAKKELFMLFWPIFGNFWCPVVTIFFYVFYSRFLLVHL